MSHDKYEYATRRIKLTGYTIDTDILNAWGNHGWEMCGYDCDMGVAIFKRKKDKDNYKEKESDN